MFNICSLKVPSSNQYLRGQLRAVGRENYRTFDTGICYTLGGQVDVDLLYDVRVVHTPAHQDVECHS